MIRRALLISSSERYLVLGVNFLSVAALARLLTPDEVGVSAISAVILIAGESLRDFGVSQFLVQQLTLKRLQVRTAATITMGLTLAISGLFWLAADWIASVYTQPKLVPYLHVLAISFVSGGLLAPQMALMRRDVDFGWVALVNVIGAWATAAVSVIAAVLGAGFMSYAWGALAGGWLATLIALAIRRQFWIYVPNLSAWREVANFGAYSSAFGIIWKLQDVAPTVLLGHFYGASTVGFYSRATLVCSVPDKILLSGIYPVVLPALSAEVRAGRCLAPTFRQALSYITAVQWPALALLILLAEPAVALLLGPQWGQTVSIVRIMAIAAFLGAPSVFAFPLFVAAGAIRELVIVGLLTLLVSTVLLALAAPHGITAAALTLCPVTAFQSAAHLTFIRRRMPLSFADVLVALRPSACLTLFSATPAAVTLAVTPTVVPAFYATFMCVAAAAIGWACGVRIVRHPVLVELERIWGAIAHRTGARGMRNLFRPVREL